MLSRCWMSAMQNGRTPAYSGTCCVHRIANHVSCKQTKLTTILIILSLLGSSECVSEHYVLMLPCVHADSAPRCREEFIQNGSCVSTCAIAVVRWGPPPSENRSYRVLKCKYLLNLPVHYWLSLIIALLRHRCTPFIKHLAVLNENMLLI